MVKTRTLLGVLLPLAAAAALCGCSARGRLVSVRPESLQLSAGTTGAVLSLAADASALYAVFADRATAGLDLVTIPAAPHLPGSAPPPELIDKVDTAAPLSTSFGEHVLAAGGGRIAVLYLDRKMDAHSVLKLASRGAAGAAQWDLDVLEPAGDPLALASDGGGRFAAAWTSGLLSYRLPGGQAAPPAPPIPLQVEGKPGSDGQGGFTAYDRLASVLLWFGWNGSGFTVKPVPEGGTVSACLRSPGGRLAVASYNPRQRRLFLHQEAPGASAFSSQTVTVCDGTTGVALLPGPSDSSFVFVYDETRTISAGRTAYQLSVIAPGFLLGALGSRYRKAVLTEGDLRIDGFAAARTPDALYVLLSQGGLRILRIPLG